MCCAMKNFFNTAHVHIIMLNKCDHAVSVVFNINFEKKTCMGRPGYKATVTMHGMTVQSGLL